MSKYDNLGQGCNKCGFDDNGEFTMYCINCYNKIKEVEKIRRNNFKEEKLT